MSNTIIRAPRRDRYTIISQGILEDKYLSWAARGLLCFLLSLPDNWKIRVSHLIQIGDLKRDGIYKVLQELRNVNYVVYRRVRDSQGCFRGGVYIVHENPDSPHTDLPDTASPNPVKPEALPNTDVYQIPTTTTEEGGGGGLLDLEYPKDLLPAERTQAEQMIQAITDPLVAQQILDEWAGIISAGAIRASRLGCLRGLIKRAQEGTFTQERGLLIAKARSTKRRVTAAHEASKAKLPLPEDSESNNKLSRRIVEIANRAKQRQ